MPPIDERRIVRDMKQLSGLHPDSADSSRAIHRTRAALTDLHNPRQHLFRRLIMPTSIAATLALAITLALLLMPQHSASAAEALEKVADATQKYDGWMHLTVDLEASDIVQAEGVDLKGARAAEHYHIAQKIRVMDQTFNGIRQVRWWSPLTREWIEYGSNTGEVRIGVMSDITAKSLLTNPSPVTISQAIRHLKKTFDLERLDVQSEMDGALKKFEIVFPPEAQKLCKEGGCPIPERITMWVDPNTHMIQRSVGKVGVNTFAYNVTYGEPNFANIHDLGLPEGTKVVDNRPKEDVAAVMKRLSDRYEKGFGDYTAVLIEEQSFSLLSRQSETWLANRYMVADNSGGPISRDIGIPAPEGWPDSPVETLIAAALHASPEWYATYDGQHFWTGFIAAYKGPGQYDGEGQVQELIKESLMASIRSQHELPGKLWRTAENLGAVGPDAKIDIVRDEGRPGLLGLKITTYISMANPMNRRAKRRLDWTIWLDPTRDDLPVEASHYAYETDSDKLASEGRTEYLDYARLPNGQWYPTHWRDSGTYQGQDNGTRESRLKIYPDVKLDAAWFTDPLSRRKDEPVPQSSRPDPARKDDRGLLNGSLGVVVTAGVIAYLAQFLRSRGR